MTLSEKTVNEFVTKMGHLYTDTFDKTMDSSVLNIVAPLDC